MSQDGETRDRTAKWVKDGIDVQASHKAVLSCKSPALDPVSSNNEGGTWTGEGEGGVQDEGQGVGNWLQQQEMRRRGCTMQLQQPGNNCFI